MENRSMFPQCLENKHLPNTYFDIMKTTYLLTLLLESSKAQSLRPNSLFRSNLKSGFFEWMTEF